MSDPKLNIRQKPAGGQKMPVGNESKVDMKGAFGSVVGDTGLKGAMRELVEQHPYGHDDYEVHHGTMDHMRHAPLHGLRPTK